MRVLADNGIQTGVTMMPILPFIEDNEENIEAIVEQAADAGASLHPPVDGDEYARPATRLLLQAT